MRAVQIHECGGPDALRIETIDRPGPAAGEALVKVEAAGVNFIDIQFRSGAYPVASLPFTPGSEAAGTVVETGEGCEDLAVGERVAWAMVLGAYAEYAVVPADRLVRIPDGVDSDSAAALMLQGLTAHYLTHSTRRLAAGDSVLVHAAAGGAGLLITQVAKRLGATVFGTVGSPEKAQIALDNGVDAAIEYRHARFDEEVRRLTHGRGVDVVYDSVGRDTFAQSLDCLAPRGTLALFGFASGPVEPFDPAILGTKGSLYLTRPGLNQYIARRDELVARASDIFGWHEAGELRLRIDRVLPLEQAADAHRALESRSTSGKLLLKP